jgi:hypothetical protein
MGHAVVWGVTVHHSPALWARAGMPAGQQHMHTQGFTPIYHACAVSLTFHLHFESVLCLVCTVSAPAVTQALLVRLARRSCQHLTLAVLSRALPPAVV